MIQKEKRSNNLVLYLIQKEEVQSRKEKNTADGFIHAKYVSGQDSENIMETLRGGIYESTVLCDLFNFLC